MTDKHLKGVTEIIATHTRLEPRIIRADDLLDGLGLDSIAVINIGRDIIDRFQVDIEEREICGWKTVGDILKSIDR